MCLRTCLVSDLFTRTICCVDRCMYCGACNCLHPGASRLAKYSCRVCQRQHPTQRITKPPAVTVHCRSDITTVRERVCVSWAAKLWTPSRRAPAVPGHARSARVCNGVGRVLQLQQCSVTYGVVRTLAGTALAGGRALSTTPSASAAVPLTLRLAPTRAAGWPSVHNSQPRCVAHLEKPSTGRTATPTATRTPATRLPDA